jgi:leader peptidase (prepilin peptidase)/N-methyltransferase
LLGITLIALQRGGMKLALPFGTFLALGALAAMFVGDPLIAWYSQFF